MRLLIISDTPHYAGRHGTVLGFGPAVREYDQLATLFDQVVHIAPLHDGVAPAHARAYSSDHLRVRTIRPAGGGGVRAKLGVVGSIPGWVRVMFGELRDADAVHVRCPANVCLIALLVLTLRRRPRLRWVQYAVDWSGGPGEAPSYRFQRWLLRHHVCRAAVTVNGAWPDQPPHVHTFDNPALADDELQPAWEAASRKPAPDPVRILFVGRFVPSKAPLRALAVADRLRARGVPFHLDLAGDGEERARSEAFAAEHGLQEHVTFHGWLDRSRLDSLYADAHVFLLPSVGEGFPRTVAEAMAFGAVPVAGDCSCVRQVLTDVGVGRAIDPGDVGGYADAIAELVTPHRWEQQSAAAVAAAPRFTYANHLAALRTLIGPTGGDALLRVLLLAPEVPPPIGGLQRMADELHRQLQRVAEVHLVATSTRPSGAPDASIVSRGRSRGGRVVVPARYAIEVRRQLRVRDVDVIHALTWRSAIPLLLPRSRRPPLVLHCLGAELLRTGGLASVRRRVLAEADVLLAISDHTAQIVHSLSGRAAQVVPPGVDLGRFAAIRSPRPPSAGDVLRVVSVGRLEPRKGHDELIRAVSQLGDSGVACRLTIVGDGPDARRLDALVAELGRQEEVVILHDADDAALLRELEHADVFALLSRDGPTDIEGFGIAYVEAAAAGLPIVAGDAPGVRDAVQEGVNAILTRSTSEAVDALRLLASDHGARTEMGAAGPAFARRFAWPVIVEELEAVYASVRATSR